MQGKSVESQVSQRNSRESADALWSEVFSNANVFGAFQAIA